VVKGEERISVAFLDGAKDGQYHVCVLLHTAVL
jgi:hypothetical protein